MPRFLAEVLDRRLRDLGDDQLVHPRLRHEALEPAQSDAGVDLDRGDLLAVGVLLVERAGTQLGSLLGLL